MISFLVVFLVVQTRYSAPDDIVGSTVHPFAALGALLVARLRRARFIFEVRDLWPQTLVDLGALRVGSPGERLLSATRSPARATRLDRHHPAPRHAGLSRRARAPLGSYRVHPERRRPRRRSTPARPLGTSRGSSRRCLAEARRLRSDGRFVVGYLGSFGRVNRLDVVIAAATIAELRAPGRVGVLLVGDGPEREDLEHRAASQVNVAFGPAVPKVFVPMILRVLDATVVHTTYTPVYRFGISFNKLFEYMAAAEAGGLRAARAPTTPLRLSGAGLTVPPDDPERLASAFLELAGMPPDGLVAMGSAGRSFVAREHDLAHLETGSPPSSRDAHCQTTLAPASSTTRSRDRRRYRGPPGPRRAPPEHELDQPSVGIGVGVDVRGPTVGELRIRCSCPPRIPTPSAGVEPGHTPRERESQARILAMVRAVVTGCTTLGLVVTCGAVMGGDHDPGAALSRDHRPIGRVASAADTAGAVAAIG